MKKLLMITGDRALAQGKKGPFYYMLEEFSKHWERVDIITPKVQNEKRKTKNFHGNVFVHSSPWSLWWQPWFILRKGIKIYREQKFDVFTVHSYPPFYNDIGGRWLFNKIKVPYILEVMHITGYPKSGSFKEWFYKVLTKIFIKYSAKKAKAVRVINKKQTPEFLKKAGVPEKKLKYIPAFYIDLEVFKPLHSVQGKPKKYDLVFSGRLVKNKGILLLLKAIVKIKKSVPNIRLLIIGSGPLKSKIESFVKKNSLQKNVEFSGWLETINDVARAYNQSKIFINPSFNEGGPRVALEAMACGLPVITTKVGLMIDVPENVTFINWDPKDIAKKIFWTFDVQNKKLIAETAEKGHQAVKQFERKKMIENYAESYKKLITYGK